MKYPLGEVAPRTEDDFVQLTDIMALVLERLDLSPPPGIQGGTPPRTGHPPLAEIYPLEFLSPEGDSKAIYRGDLKYVWNAGGHHGLYDLARDPGEQVNLVDDRSEEAREMKKSLLAYLARLPGPKKGGREQIVDEETREALKGLGYLK
jgi:arylsulfatase A-like enzyme